MTHVVHMMTFNHLFSFVLSLLPLSLVTSYTYAHGFNIRQSGELGSNEFALYLGKEQ